ncbi:GNAT family N-acetyltransferase [Planctomycetota bacterium]
MSGFILRDVCLEDFSLILTWWNDVEMQYLVGQCGDDWHPDSLRQWFNLPPHKQQSWVIALPDGAIGTAELAGISSSKKSANLQIIIGEKGWWHHGIGSAVAHTVCMKAFGAIGLESLFLKIPAYNERALAWAKKIGFKLSHCQPAPINFKGKIVTLQIYLLCRDDFLNNNRNSIQENI